MIENIDLGGDVWILFVECDEIICGCIEQHISPQGSVCMNYLKFLGRNDSGTFAAKEFEVLDWEPETFTLEEDMTCPTCGKRGWIVKGQWIPW